MTYEERQTVEESAKLMHTLARAHEEKYLRAWQIIESYCNWLWNERERLLEAAQQPCPEPEKKT